MRILLGAIRCDKGAVERNLGEHRRALEEASAAGCTLAVFPEMSLTGSLDPARTPQRCIDLSDPAVAALAELSAELGVAALFGIAEAGPFITQVLAADGRVAGVQRKRRLGEGEEAFRAADDDTVFDLHGTRFAVAICAEHRVDRPFEYARAQDVPLVCFCAAPGLDERRATEQEWRAGWDWWGSAGLADARRHARAHGLWIAIATQAGATVDEDFPGLAALVDPSGEVVEQLPDWKPGTLVVDVPV